MRFEYRFEFAQRETEVRLSLLSVQAGTIVSWDQADGLGASGLRKFDKAERFLRLTSVQSSNRLTSATASMRSS